MSGRELIRETRGESVSMRRRIAWVSPMNYSIAPPFIVRSVRTLDGIPRGGKTEIVIAIFGETPCPAR